MVSTENRGQKWLGIAFGGTSHLNHSPEANALHPEFLLFTQNSKVFKTPCTNPVIFIIEKNPNQTKQTMKATITNKLEFFVLRNLTDNDITQR